MKVTIKAYQFEELDDKAKYNALIWLNRNPLEYENEKGEMVLEHWYYVYQDDPSYVIDHCDSNEYLFSKYGEPIHHLIVEA